MKMRSEKNQYLLWYSLPHYCALYCAAFIRHLQTQHPVSTFGIEKVCGLMKTLPAIQKKQVSRADFSTRPVGRTVWKESLVLSSKYERTSRIFVPGVLWFLYTLFAVCKQSLQINKSILVSELNIWAKICVFSNRDVRKRGLIVYLAALKKGAIRVAHPYYVIYR